MITDFTAMAQLGLNVVRVYTVPPPDVIEAAKVTGLKLIVGLDYDDWRVVDQSGLSADRVVRFHGLQAVERALEVCAGRPEVLAISVGNEIPVDLVRLHGPSRVERSLERFIAAVHDGDPSMQATYTNYPSTEFLDPGGQDLMTWNVFLEQRARFRAYLTHLMALAGSRPTILSEFGLAAGVHGDRAQSESLDWQLEELVASGAAGGTIFSWTDEWAVADVPVTDWGFGITDVARTRKAAADVAQRWPSRLQLDLNPRVSVIICAFNESKHIDPCIRSVLASGYPNVEVIVCDDGSNDDTADRASNYPVRLLRLGRGGLSAARNAGLAAATGEIVAYLDADAEASPGWLEQLVRRFDHPSVAAVGGPNHAFPHVGLVEEAVDASPGNPREVLIGDDEAEHIAGCNMAFRREVLSNLGGFDVAYRAAGDDVDVCWRLLDLGWQIGFAPAAVIRHHRRATVKGFLRQQRGYGRAERLLQGPHHQRFNRLGQARWQGFVYGGLSVSRRFLRPVVYHGTLGGAPFQPTVRRRGEVSMSGLIAIIPLAIVIGLLAAAAGASTGRFSFAAAGLVVGFAPALVVAFIAGMGARPRVGVRQRVRFRVLVAALHVLQPLARFWGRLSVRSLPRPVEPPLVWTGNRMAVIDEVASRLRNEHWTIGMGGETDSHDLDVRRRFARAKVNIAVVWSWTPRCSVRIRPRYGALAAGAVAALAVSGTTGMLPVLGIVVAVTVDGWWCIGRLKRSIGDLARKAEVVVASPLLVENLSAGATFEGIQ